MTAALAIDARSTTPPPPQPPTRTPSSASPPRNGAGRLEKVPKNEYGNVEFFDCSPAFLPPGTEHVRGDQIGRVAAKLGVDYAPALTGFESKQGRQVPVLDGIIVCKEQSQVRGGSAP